MNSNKYIPQLIPNFFISVSWRLREQDLNSHSLHDEPGCIQTIVRLEHSIEAPVRKSWNSLTTATEQGDENNWLELIEPLNIIQSCCKTTVAVILQTDKYLVWIIGFP